MLVRWGRCIIAVVAASYLLVFLFTNKQWEWSTATAASLNPASEASGTFSWATTDATPLGRTTLLFSATDARGALTTREVTVEVLPREAQRDGGGGGDERGGGESEAQPTNSRTGRIAGTASRIFPVRKDSVITGSYSGLITDGARSVAKLAHNQALFAQRVTQASGTCTLTAVVKGDRGPNPKQTVKFVTRINKKAWKVLTLPPGHTDNRYRTYTIGVLRNFKPGTTLSWQLLNDAYDKDYLKRTGQLPEDRDLNLIIEKTMLECG